MNNNSSRTPHLTLARELADRFSAFSEVEAVALAGSSTSGRFDATSDIDLYVYTTSMVPLQSRIDLVADMGATKTDLGLDFWGAGDEWFDKETGIEVDIVYFDKRWMQEQIEAVLLYHHASMGYTTCLWHTVKFSQSMFDRQSWFGDLMRLCDQPYPEPLRNAIVAHNHPVLRNVIPSYRNQIAKALKRNDAVSVNHRLAALLASYFDVLFALNNATHPGEKRMLQAAEQRCPVRPPSMSRQITDLLQASASMDLVMLSTLDGLLDELDHILVKMGYDPQSSHPFTKSHPSR